MKKKQKQNRAAICNNESAIHQSPFQGNGELRPRFNLYSISSNIRTSVQFTVYKIRTKKHKKMCELIQFLLS